MIAIVGYDKQANRDCNFEARVPGQLDQVLFPEPLETFKLIDWVPIHPTCKLNLNGVTKSGLREYHNQTGPKGISNYTNKIIDIKLGHFETRT